MADYAKTWIDQRPLKARTKIGYEALLNRRIKDSMLAQVPLKNLTADAVRSWYAAMGKDSPTARSHAYQLLHAVCATAVTDGLLPSNPCNIPKVMTPKTKKQPVILEPGESPPWPTPFHYHGSASWSSSAPGVVSGGAKCRNCAAGTSAPTTASSQCHARSPIAVAAGWTALNRSRAGRSWCRPTSAPTWLSICSSMSRRAPTRCYSCPSAADVI